MTALARRRDSSRFWSAAPRWSAWPTTTTVTRGSAVMAASTRSSSAAWAGRMAVEPVGKRLDVRSSTRTGTEAGTVGSITRWLTTGMFGSFEYAWAKAVPRSTVAWSGTAPSNVIWAVSNTTTTGGRVPSGSGRVVVPAAAGRAAAAPVAAVAAVVVAGGAVVVGAGVVVGATVVVAAAVVVADAVVVAAAVVVGGAVVVGAALVAG